MTNRYIATIRHHSISRAPVIECGNNLTQAKRKATAFFGGGYLDHVIEISDTLEMGYPVIVALRRIGDKKWIS